MIGQYGVGFLYVGEVPQAAVSVQQHLPPTQGCPAALEWMTDELTLPPGGSVSFGGEVLIDEGGRQSNDPRRLVSAGRRIVTVDVRAAAESGRKVPGAVTLVAAEPTRAKVLVRQFRLAAGRRAGGKVLAEFSANLKPGRGSFHHVDVLPDAKGLLHVEAVMSDQAGRKLAAAQARTLVDGEGSTGELGRTWRTYRRKLPARKAVYKGPWKKVGALRAPHFRPLPAADDHARRQLAFLRERYPWQAEMLAGAAEVLKVDPARLAYSEPAAAPEAAACMDVFFNGPDGPINAFSKERSGINYAGLEYVKVIP